MAAMSIHQDADAEQISAALPALTASRPGPLAHQSGLGSGSGDAMVQIRMSPLDLKLLDPANFAD